MAIDIFREGMSQYLTQEAKRIAAERLQNAALDLQIGADSIDEIGNVTSTAASELTKGTSTIKSLLDEINSFTAKLTDKFTKAGIALPSAEILQMQPKPTIVEDKPQKTEEYPNKDEIMQRIRMSLGNVDAFTLPSVPEEDNVLELPLGRLNLPVRAYHCLKNSGRVSLGDILGTPVEIFSDPAKIRNFGSRAQEDTIEALYNFGVRPKESDQVPSQHTS